MLRVIIELVPGGRRELRRTIASMHIGNQSDLADISNYKVDAVASANPVTAKPACSATCTVLGHDRRQSVWSLIAKAASAIQQAEFDEL
jgi:hypothetical protein